MRAPGRVPASRRGVIGGSVTRGKTVARIAGTAFFPLKIGIGVGTIRAMRRGVKQRICGGANSKVIGNALYMDRSIAY